MKKYILNFILLLLQKKWILENSQTNRYLTSYAIDLSALSCQDKTYY